jgi:hypothetical protein
MEVLEFLTVEKKISNDISPENLFAQDERTSHRTFSYVPDQRNSRLAFITILITIIYEYFKISIKTGKYPPFCG